MATQKYTKASLCSRLWRSSLPSSRSLSAPSAAASVSSVPNSFLAAARSYEQQYRYGQDGSLVSIIKTE